MHRKLLCKLASAVLRYLREVCQLYVGEINTRNVKNSVRVKKEFLLEGKLGEQMLSILEVINVNSDV